MKIVRNGQEFKLTEQELYEAHREFVVNFMENELLENFNVNETESKNIAEAAYDRYCEGNGETEYECIEWAYENQKKIRTGENMYKEKETGTKREADMRQTEDVLSTGIIRRVDDLGRIVIPKEIRKRYGIAEDTPLELFPTNNGILFKVYRSGEGIRLAIKTVKEAVNDYADELGADEYDHILKEAESLCQFVRRKGTKR